MSRLSTLFVLLLCLTIPLVSGCKKNALETQTPPEQTAPQPEQVGASKTFQNAQIGIDGLAAIQWQPEVMAPVSVLLSQQDAAEQLRELITKNTITDPTQIIPTISVLPKTDPLLSGTQTRDLYLATQTRYTVQDKLVFVGGAYLDEMITVLQGDKAITGNDLTVMLSGETTVLLVTNTTDHTLRLGQGGTMTFVEPGSLVFIELHKAPVVQGIELRYGKQSLYNETFSRQQPRERGKTGDYPYSFPDNFYQSPDIAVYPGTGYTIGLQATTAGSAGQRSELGLYQIVRSPTTTQEQTDFGLTGEVGALSYEAWTKQLGATEPPKLKVLSYEQRGYLELSGAVELLASGAVSLHLPKAPGSYLLYARDTNGFAYALYLIAEDNFAPTLSDNKDEMTLILTARVPFDQAEVQKQFEQWLGTGKIDVAASDPYGHELQIHYRIPPQTEITKQIDLRSVFGQTTINYITLFVPTIPKQFIKQQIYGGAINLLPAKGYRGSRLELGYKNTFAFTVYFQACTRINPDTTTPGYLVEQLLYRCSGPQYTQKIQRKDGERWTLYEEEVTIPTQLDSATHFRVAFSPTMQDATYFSKTNIGLLAKMTANETVSLRGFAFDTGKPVEKATVTVRNEQGRQIMSGAMSDGYLQLDLSKVSSDMTVIDVTTSGDVSSIVLSKQGNSRRARQRNEEYRSYEYGSFVNSNDLYSSANAGYGRQRSDGSLVKIYGYADRGLYKPGDKVNFAGFVRDLGQIGTAAHIPKGSIRVVLNDTQGQQVAAKLFTGTDTYGAFHGSFTLPETAPLGTYYMVYEFEGQQSRSHDLRVQEFQKASFEMKPQLITSGTKVLLTVEPTYYFGSPVDTYDLDIDRSVAGENACRRCRRWNTDDYYFNHVFGQQISTGGALGFLQVGSGQFAIELLDLSTLPNRGYTFTLRADLRIKDRLSDETQFESLSEEVSPAIKLGLQGQPEERVYETGANVEGVVQDAKNVMQQLTYSWYYEPFVAQYQYGVDGNRYVIDGHKLVEISSGTLDQKTFTLTAPLDEAGSYLLRVVATDHAGKVVGEVQKRLSYYARDAQQSISYAGKLTNNYKLIVNVPKKTYTSGDMLPIDIEPYISGATVLVTIEKGKQILDTLLTTLDGKQLQLPVRDGYYPNVHISVVQVAGEDLGLSDKRHEPRFFVGYAQAEIDEATINLQIEVTSDKQSYQPGETATITLKTKDANGVPTNAQLSVAVIDKGLIDIYHIIKDPIPALYNKMPPLVATFTNMKFLYQALKVFSADGSKGGGGGGDGLGNFGNIRTKLLDIALREPAVQTKNGEATLQMKVPDNLTTRVVDVIGITQDAKLGTTTSKLVVSKPLLIEANLPTFLTYGDTLQLPMKVITTQDSSLLAETDITVEGTIKTEDGRSFPLGKMTTKPNSRVVLPISVPDQVWDQTNLILELTASGGDEQDAVRQTIPLRTEGFERHAYMMQTATTGLYTFTADQLAQGSLAVALSPLPIGAFEQALDYLLRYPYGCSEQLMSSLYPIVITKQLTDAGVLGSRYINNQQQIKLPHSIQRQDMSTLMSNGLYQLFANQQADGGFGYRQGDSSHYALSAYIYGALLQMQQTFPESIDGITEKLTQLETYLATNGATYPEQYLYYLRQRATHRKDVSANEVRQLIANNSLDLSTANVLAFGIATALGEDARSRELVAKIDRETLGSGNQQEAYGYGVYIDSTILQAIYLRALLKFDPGHANIKPVVQHLLNLRDEQGIRSRSTQRNMQVLLALGDYLQTIQTNGAIHCAWSINDDAYTGSLLGTDKLLLTNTQQFIDTPAMTFKRMCTKEVIAEANLTYVPKDIIATGNELHNVTLLEEAVQTSGVTIGDLSQMTAAFQVAQDARQVAIELFIPSTFKFLETIKKQQQGQQNPRDRSAYPFTVNGGRECSPTHREIRYDRLFLYYDTLKASDRCEVSIQVLKAYDGKPNIMPARLREMYQTTVWGSATPKFK